MNCETKLNKRDAGIDTKKGNKVNMSGAKTVVNQIELNSTVGINVPGTKLNRCAECKMRIKLAKWMQAAELNVVMLKLV